MIDYSTLNEAQLEAVQTTEGYVRVVASAGSGKTRALAYRYAYLAEKLGISPRNIACVTFTNKAAREMKDRIRSMIGSLNNPFIILIVEGCTDKKFFFPFFPGVAIEPAGNKRLVHKMLHSVTMAGGEKKRRWIRALVDRDYDFLTEHQSDNELIVYTDANSLETMIWMTDDNTVLSSIVSQLVEVDTMEQVPLSAIYDHTYQAAKLLGLIRLADALHKAWNLDLKPFALRKDMLDEQDNLRLEPVVDDILSKAETEVKCSRDELIAEVRRLQQDNIDQWQLMQGHDLSEAFVMHIKKNCTFYPENWPGWDDLKMAIQDFEGKAQLAANKAGLKETDCFQQISDWIVEYN